MTLEDWTACLRYCGVPQSTAELWGPLFTEKVQPFAFSKGLDEIDDFVGQVIYESLYLSRTEENLYYTARRLMVVWPQRFPDAQSTVGYVWDPAKLAAHVYDMRADLGNTLPGDGYTYRGRGLIMVTGKGNYRVVSGAMGVDFITHPELLAVPSYALDAAIAWWERKIPDAAMGNIVRVTKGVNGGVEGLAARQSITNRAKERIHP
jgi:putative chitinase